MKYKPNPIDTSNIVLPEDIMDILEYLAKNVHEVWADKKISEGYEHGAELNEKKKTHPSLVPYEQLSESQKEYDRNTLLEAIRLLIKQGYTIEKRG